MTIQYLYVMDSNGENRKKTAKLENVQNVTAVLRSEERRCRERV